jgi:uncharacterized protein YecE (DUF72 family)
VPGLRVRVGTSGWNYPEWKGAFYPGDLAAARMLAFYAGRFPTVEVNATFYRMPTPKILGAWAAQVPEAFVFALKAPRRITHFARLRDVDEPVDFLCETARTLGGRLGPLLFQLPPNFAKDADRLARVLARIPRDLHAAFEFRHASWFADDVYGLLRRANAALAIVDTEEGTTPEVATADWGYFRLREVDYADADLARWAGRIRTIGAGWAEAFVYFKHEERATGPALAGRLVALLEGAA